jgi:nitrate/nitrite-specific signal transduction histidine kinase
MLIEYEDQLSYYITAFGSKERLNKIKINAALTGNKILEEIENMSHSASLSLEEITHNSSKRIGGVQLILISTIITTFLLSIIIAYNLIKSVTIPVRKLLDATSVITAGKLGERISFKDKTEFTELASHFNIMSIGLKEKTERLEQNSNELKQRVKELEEFYEISIGRELKMKELKVEINKLKTQLSKYKRS